MESLNFYFKTDTEAESAHTSAQTGVRYLLQSLVMLQHRIWG